MFFGLQLALIRFSFTIFGKFYTGSQNYRVFQQNRPEAVLELEQIAVLPERHGQGIGEKLIQESLPYVRAQLAKQDSRLKHIVVTTRAENHAQELYKSTLGAEVEAIISNLYSADEVFMVARNV